MNACDGPQTHTTQKKMPHEAFKFSNLIQTLHLNPSCNQLVRLLSRDDAFLSSGDKCDAVMVTGSSVMLSASQHPPLHNIEIF